jgi:two-component system, OmpR family, response regulator
MLNALIIDDEVDMCYLLVAILKNKNFQTEFVNSLSEAKEKLKTFSPSLIFLDNHLPDGLGLDFIKDIKELYAFANIIVITAHDTFSDRAKAFNDGAVAFIGKPFSTEKIYEEIDRFAFE